MARGPLHNFALVRQSRDEQIAAREASMALIKQLLAEGPKTTGELGRALTEELKVVRATVFGYLRHMHKTERSIMPIARGQGRAKIWSLGEDPTLPDPDDVIDRNFARKCATVPARQVGMWRDPLDVALFGPAQRAAA